MRNLLVFEMRDTIRSTAVGDGIGRLVGDGTGKLVGEAVGTPVGSPVGAPDGLFAFNARCKGASGLSECGDPRIES